MKEYEGRVQIIETFSINVEGENEEDALKKLRNMTTLEIRNQGSSQSLETDFADIEGEAW